MQKTELDEVIHSLIAPLMKNNVAITPASRLVEDLGLDSLQIINLLMSIEHSLKIKLQASDLVFDDLSSVGTLSAKLQRML